MTPQPPAPVGGTKTKPIVWHRDDCDVDYEGQWYCVRGCPIAKRLRAQLRRSLKKSSPLISAQARD
jgi:hypothetical protein